MLLILLSVVKEIQYHITFDIKVVMLKDVNVTHEQTDRLIVSIIAYIWAIRLLVCLLPHMARVSKRVIRTLPALKLRNAENLMDYEWIHSLITVCIWT